MFVNNLQSFKDYEKMDVMQLKAKLKEEKQQKGTWTGSLSIKLLFVQSRQKDDDEPINSKPTNLGISNFEMRNDFFSQSGSKDHQVSPQHQHQ